LPSGDCGPKKSEASLAAVQQTPTRSHEARKRSAFSWYLDEYIETAMSFSFLLALQASPMVMLSDSSAPSDSMLSSCT
jgi:hypothetical protein